MGGGNETRLIVLACVERSPGVMRFGSEFLEQYLPCLSSSMAILPTGIRQQQTDVMPLSVAA